MSASVAAIPPGHVGTVVTFLEMRAPPAPSPFPSAPLRMRRCEAIGADAYRALFRRVGGRWLWYSRLLMDDSALLVRIGELHVVADPGGIEVGLVELERRPEGGACAIRFLGLVPELAGKGHGRWLLAETLALCWRKDTEIVTVSTCSLDHPAALPAYLRAGFVAVGRAFEHFPDPRLSGLLPEDVAPQIPLVGSDSASRA